MIHYNKKCYYCSNSIELSKEIRLTNRHSFCSEECLDKYISEGGT